ncbi:polysaccharide lyase 8 family protein [Zhouia spongiae]|uniref:Polysaccharide lyase 8 family protein n=1 Tax=Zhouia spongiae TaxID=2202721 RepID=A0ABY3YJQ7_9FLAO|nr:polysaccharide lyase 8 family protein [Zhouia spongiae]UNY98084.1 polysaccharide lyase 8 family protein [Zhouia spongiae]
MKQWFLFLYAICMIPAYGQSDFDKIIHNIQQEELSGIDNTSKLSDSVAILLKKQRKDGSWQHIDYTITHRTLWDPLKHLNHLNQLAKAYIFPESSFYQDPSLHHALHIGLKYWYDSNPESNNWWFNQIAVPQRLGVILILLEKSNVPFDTELKHNLIDRMHRGDPKKWTGANKLDIALHYIFRGSLLRDKNVLKTGVDESFFPIRFTMKEGLQHDYSYHQHGPQLYIGGYGTVFIENEVLAATYVSGTSYALSGQKLKLLSDFILHTYLNTLQNGYMDFSVNGRSVSRKNRLKGDAVINTLGKLKRIDPDREQEYTRAVSGLKHRSEESKVNKHFHFWRSDYTLHNKNYSFSVRTSSNRTSRTENGNEENLKAYFLTDGATNIRVQGDEYFNIFPVWDWNKIPGVTAPVLKEIPQRKAWQVLGTSHFTGGISNGAYGSHTYRLDDYGIQAKKSWFFFDDEIVCLGTDIRSDSLKNVITTVDQALSPNSVSIKEHRKIKHITGGTFKFNNDLNWVINNKIAYLFPEGGQLQFTKGFQKGNWHDINKTHPDKEVEKEVFTLWFDHGQHPDKATYKYIVVPGVSDRKELKKYRNKDIEILKNTPEVQAVKSNDLNLLQLVFFEAATFNHKDFKVVVDKPCAVMIDYKDYRAPLLYISDPSQKNEFIHLGIQFPKAKISDEFELEMPKEEKAGSTLQIELTSLPE